MSGGPRRLRVCLAAAPARVSEDWRPRDLTWDEYLAAVRLEDPAGHKDCGGVFGGSLDGPRKKDEHVRSRSVVYLDADKADATFAADLQVALGDHALAWHTTASHTPEAPRYRVHLPLDREVTGEEAERVTLALMDALGPEQFDRTCAQPSRMMFLASRPDDGTPYESGRTSSEKPLDADAWLAEADERGVTARARKAREARRDLEPADGEPSDRQRAKAAAILAKAAREVRDPGEYGGRNSALIAWLPTLYRLSLGGCLDPEEVDREMWEAASFAEGPDEWTRREHHEVSGNALEYAEEDGGGLPTVADAADDFGPVPAEDDGAGGGWAPVDLAATVAGLRDGTLTRPEPTIGDFGGGRLFYAGRINSVHGDSTGGKTWTALVTAAQEMAAGETVVYVDLEDSPAGVLSRLLVDLDVPEEDVTERFVYLHPDERLRPAAAAELAALLDARRPSLVVVDSTGEALAIEGANPNADEEVARWFRLLPRLAIRCGAAVLLLDHATKAGDNDLWPIGSQRKKSAVTGAAYLQKVAVPFGKDQDGKAVLICAKDRHGNYPLRRRVAALRVRGGEISLAAEDHGDAASDFQPTGLMERVSRYLEAAAEPRSGRQVLAAVTGKKVHKVAALAALVTGEYVAVSPGQRGAQLHTSLKPYREDA